MKNATTSHKCAHHDFEQTQLTISVHWNWCSNHQYSLLFFSGNDVLFAVPISRKRAEKLIELGMNHGS